MAKKWPKIGEKKLHIIPYSNEHLSGYQQFAQNNFGPMSYQATRNYLPWLYTETPFEERKIGFLALNEREDIVGSIHKMTLPWVGENNNISISAAHNLMVQKEYRRGVGASLIFACYSDGAHTLAPGVDSASSEIYVKLRCHEIAGFRSFKVVRPIAAAVSFARRAAGYPVRDVGLSEARLRSCCDGNFLISADPSEGQLEDIANRLNESNLEKMSVKWNKELLRWRFFHSIGPKHVVVHTKNSLKSFAIFSIGVRNSIRLSRLLIVSSDGEKCFLSLLGASISILQRIGMEVLNFYSTDVNIIAFLKKAGIQDQKPSKKVRAFIYHKDRKQEKLSFALDGSSADYGFEGLCQKVGN